MSDVAVHLLSPYALSVPGGAQGQARLMAIELARRGRHVEVTSPGTVDPELRDAGIAHHATGRVTSVPANGSRAPLSLSLRASRAVARRIESSGAVAHVHEPFAPVLAYSLLARGRAGVVATFHRGGLGPAYRFGRPLIARLSRGIDEAFAVSEPAASTAREGTGVDASICFNGLDLRALDEAVPAAFDGPTVLFVGRHEPRKGLSVLLEAAAEMDASTRFLIVGEGPQTASLRERHGADARIEWLGRVDDARLRSLLRGVDVLCVPSLAGESFGMVPLEGMAARTRVVASDIDGYREATAGHARLVEPSRPDLLAVALREELSAPSASVIEAARAYAEGFSIARLVDVYEPAYERVASARSTSR